MSRELKALWKHPDVAATSIESFRCLANKKYGLNLCNYHDLWEWSTNSLNDFWMLVWEFTKVRASIQPDYAITDLEATRLTPSPKWFPQARLNFAQNILESSYAPLAEDERPVLTGVREGGREIEHVSLSELRSRVGVLANALARSGVQRLDRVACVGSNSVTTFIVFLATASIGAIFTCCSPEMGEKGILDRFLQVKPKILFTDDWIVYNNKRIGCLDKAKRVASVLRARGDLQTLVVISRNNETYLDDRS